MPAKVLAVVPPATVSAVSLKLAMNRLLTLEPLGDALSSSMAASVLLPDATGASFTAVTLWLSVTVALLYAVEPPRVETSNIAFVLTVVGLSISTTVRSGAEPLKFATGRNRR